MMNLIIVNFQILTLMTVSKSMADTGIFKKLLDEVYWNIRNFIIIVYHSRLSIILFINVNQGSKRSKDYMIAAEIIGT